MQMWDNYVLTSQQIHLWFAEDGIPLSLDVFEDFVYFTTLQTNTVNNINKFGNNNPGIMPISQHTMKVTDVLIVQEQKQDYRSECYVCWC